MNKNEGLRCALRLYAGKIRTILYILHKQEELFALFHDKPADYLIGQKDYSKITDFCLILSISQVI